MAKGWRKDWASICLSLIVTLLLAFQLVQNEEYRGWQIAGLGASILIGTIIVLVEMRRRGHEKPKEE